jgi:hypothetical protein
VARYLFAISALAVLNALAAAVEPTPAGVVNGEELFRPETVAKAESLIHGLQRDYHFDVRVETLELPEADRKNRSQARFFAQLGRDRAEKANLDGLYILICTAPAYVQVTVYPKSADALFSEYQRRELQKLLTARLQPLRRGAGRGDAAAAAVGVAWQLRPTPAAAKALLEALRRGEAVVRDRAGDPNAVRPAVMGGLLAGGVGVWLLLALVRRRMAKQKPDAGLFLPTDYGSRPALLAAQFGTPAAFWIYDRLFFGRPTVVPASKPPSAPEVVAGDDSPPSDLLHPEPDHADASSRDGTG